MPLHPLYREIGTELSYLVQQRIQRERALGREVGDCTYARLQTVSGYNPRLFIADVEEGTDAANPHATGRVDAPAPLWHVHGRKR